MMTSPTLDQIPCGCLVTTALDAPVPRSVLFANRYLVDVFGFAPDALVGQPLSALLTPASNLFLESYGIPMLLRDRRCSELLLEIRSPRDGVVPVVANALLDADTEGVIWTLFDATQRDKLYQELVDTRRLLEEKSDQLYELCITDELTGLFNRRELLIRVEVVMAQARRRGSPVSALMVDIDHFKDINDSHGHVVGDRVLARLGKLFREEGRLSDVIARFGGEEFVFVLPDTDERAAIAVAATEGIAVTLSIGVCSSARVGAHSWDVLLDGADQAVYLAKAGGRNRSAVYDPGQGPRTYAR
jgi:diguanylate cyclase (GGDEF)-like protein